MYIYIYTDVSRLKKSRPISCLRCELAHRLKEVAVKERSCVSLCGWPVWLKFLSAFAGQDCPPSVVQGSHTLILVSSFCGFGSHRSIIRNPSGLSGCGRKLCGVFQVTAFGKLDARKGHRRGAVATFQRILKQKRGQNSYEFWVRLTHM